MSSVNSVDTHREPLGKSYDPVPIEDKWYAKWTQNGLFHADEHSDKPPFSIVIPPPNVTGSLHVGHALDETLQDIICRYKRMRGYEVLWLPGTDHAGIATQNVVEKSLAAEGVSRHSLGREEFVARTWQWKEQYGNRIIGQLKKLGASCDWERERFTMDEGLSRAVRHIFVELYKKNLIYRGKYLINWCPRCQTALSDLEVEHTERDGKMYKVSYEFADGKGDGGLVVMTTRPETILGDVAIAIHPRDERNRHLIGRQVRVPLVGRIIPVIEDNMVDPEFGTGCVKITPAHDPNDFLVGGRHGLSAIQVIDGNGNMCEDTPYAGMDRFAAREAATEDLRKEGVLIGVDDHRHSVGHCYRCQTVVEPYLSEQWFVRTKPMAEVDIKTVQDGLIKFIPSNWTNVYYQWMENIRDWCISRQLWWGHRIPAWYCSCGEVIVGEEAPHVCPKCGCAELRQDEDVLDTWFSSALWPFSTMGWPDNTDTLKKFYPTSVLVTGFDIIFFWVARMIMMGLEFMDGVPFHHVYIHALVRDEHGQKMSKSRGNVIDPLSIIETHGADALRLTLASLTVQGRDIYLSTGKIDTYRFFMNKLWNASRFALMNLEDSDGSMEFDEANLRMHDQWILGRLGQVSAEMSRLLDGYFFGEAARLMYDFVWTELCDWYLEMSKPALKGEEGEARKRASQAVLMTVFRDVFKLLHPFIPFATEELYAQFPFSRGEFLMGTEWPCGYEKYSDAVSRMETLQDVVRGIRSLRAEARLAPQQQVPQIVWSFGESAAEDAVRHNEDMVRLLARVQEFSYIPQGGVRPAKSLSMVLGCADISLPVGELLDVGKELARLDVERGKICADMSRSEGKLNNASFVERAPAEVVEKERAAVQDMKARIARIDANMESLRR